MADLDPRVIAFRRLHESGCFVIPNPWDVGSAVVLEQLGFSALATTSAGFAWSLGRPDNFVTIDEALAHYAAVAAAVDVPVNADFERGFATDPEGVGRGDVPTRPKPWCARPDSQAVEAALCAYRQIDNSRFSSEGAGCD